MPKNIESRHSPSVSSMPRRSHRKSRQGCRECKRRHLKWCDENRPRCINCITAQLKCPYETERQPLIQQNSPASSTLVSETPQSTDTSASKSPENQFTPQHSDSLNSDHDSVAPLNMLHLELLYHWSSALYKSFLLSQEGPRTYADVCMKHGLRFPFLMRQMLATSALNVSLSQEELREVYHQHAVQLQSQALQDFNGVLKDLTESNIVAAFLVSSLVGLHAFCETFSFRDNNFSTTLDSLIGCINLLRGIRSLIGGWWPFLLTTELFPILQIASDKRAQHKEQAQELGELRKLISSADIGATSREAYEESVEELEQVYVSLHEAEPSGDTQFANMLFAWLVLVPKEYVDLVSQRRPEALVILAYYAVVLHRRRRYWAVGDAGQYLINNIATHLGGHWSQWLAWPKSQLQD